MTGRSGVGASDALAALKQMQVLHPLHALAVRSTHTFGVGNRRRQRSASEDETPGPAKSQKCLHLRAGHGTDNFFGIKRL